MLCRGSSDRNEKLYYAEAVVIGMKVMLSVVTGMKSYAL